MSIRKFKIDVRSLADNSYNKEATMATGRRMMN
jgi:hypothetical protein